MPSAPQPVPFEIAISQRDLDDLAERIDRTRWADDLDGDDWSYGVPGPYLRELADHWRHRFDWRAQEAAMNRWPHFRVVLDDVPIHFVHVRGRVAAGAPPVPLILTHGWPWTFWDYAELIGPLTDPAAHGGDPADAFDLVVPSLPGTAFSSPLRTKGIGVVETADLWVGLMRDVLGYDRFGCGGGDSGAFVSSWLGHAHADRVVGVHLTFPATTAMGDFAAIRPEQYEGEERAWLDDPPAQSRGTAAHMAVQVEDPQTLSWAMQDSPVGMAAWLVERRRNWSDCDGDVERRFTKDQLLTTVSLHWLTGTFPTSVRFYAESWREAWPLVHDRRPPVQAPTAVAVFPKELLRVPRSFMAERVNLARWTVMPRGGHFAPAEEPGLVVDDLRAFFRGLR